MGNDMEHAAAFVTRLSELGRRFTADGPFDDDYDVPHTTVHTGVFHGGSQVNIVPDSCDVDFEFRNLPADDPDTIESRIAHWLEHELTPAMRAVDPHCGATLERLYAYPGLETHPEDAIVQLIQGLTGNGERTKLAFGTEAGCFQQGLGIPVVVCGPGSIRQAHQPDEFISLDQLAACDRFLHRLLEHMVESPDHLPRSST